MNEPSKSKAGEQLAMDALKRYEQRQEETDIIARMEAEPLQLMQRTVFPSLLESAEDERRERNRDLEYESRVDYASWETDGQEAE